MTQRTGPAVGLFGGSFNPAHAGHLHVAKAGLRQLALDQVWWLVSPQNPLKPAQPSPYDRVRTIEALNLPRQMRVSHLESEYGTRYTIDFLRRLTQRHPTTRFVLMIGADNLLQMPKWKDWRGIFKTVPIAVISRPGDAIRARLSLPARDFAHARLPEAQAHVLKECPPPCWTYLTLPLNPLSSSAIRTASKSEPE